jgi:hypothetical protein
MNKPKPAPKWIVQLRQISKAGFQLKNDNFYEVFAYTEEEAKQKALYLQTQYSLGNNTPGYKNKGPFYDFAAPLGPYPYVQGIAGARLVVISVKRTK